MNDIYFFGFVKKATFDIFHVIKKMIKFINVFVV